MAKPQKKLFLLDALALIYRAHFAFNKNPRISSKGVNTSAIFGFMNSMMEVLLKEKPTHIGVAFDHSKKTFRHEQFPMYKATRQSQPEDISVAIPYIKQIIEAMNIPMLIRPGYEADDIIGTLAHRACATGEFETYMMTPDKDYGQLVNDCVFIYKPAFMGKAAEKLGVKEICDRWGIEKISQVVDMLGLVGDAVDNIPGIPGIGEKTAQKLIAEYGTIENLIANADQLKGKLKENVVQYAQQGILSKELATIHMEVPIDFDEHALIHNEYDKPRLAALLDELEFRQMKTRLLGDIVTPIKSEFAKPAGGQIGIFDPSPAFMPMPSDLSGNRETPSGADDLPFQFGDSPAPAVEPAKKTRAKKSTPVTVPTASGESTTPATVTDTATAEDAPGADVPAAATAPVARDSANWGDDAHEYEVDHSFSTERRKTINSVVHDYRLIDTPELRASLVTYLNQQTSVCFDSETTAIDPVEADLVGLSFSYAKGEAFYVP
ncbi:MAG TPA: 5'-3' exonuclease H3TH domain-containing protein, partial [Fibrella sp.]